MSTDTGDKAVIDDAIAQSQQLIAAAEAEEAEQLALLPPTPEEMAEARMMLGPDAGRLTVLRAARENRRGRPPGARNKRTDDFARYILGFGPDPAVTLMQIAGSSPDMLMEASRRTVTKVTDKGEKVEFNIEMSYAEAQALRVRCAEGLLPYIHSKKPVAIDATIRGVRIVEEIGSHDPLRDALDGEFVRVAARDPIDGEGA